MAGAIVTALLKEKPKGFSVYNVCTGHKITVKQLAEMVKGLWGSESSSKITFKDARDGDIKHSACRPDKARESLGFKASVKVEDGLKQTFDWFREKSKEGVEGKKSASGDDDKKGKKDDQRRKMEEKKSKDEAKGSKKEDKKGKKSDKDSKKEDGESDKGKK